MAEHAQNMVIAAWIWNLQQINGTGNYNHTLRRVYDPPVMYEDISEFPAVNLSYGTEEIKNRHEGSHTQQGANKWIYECEFPVIMDFFLKVANKSEMRRDILRMKYDVQFRFGQGTNYAVPDSNGIGTCLDCICMESTPFYIDSNKPNCGIQIVYNVIYRHESENPNTLA